MDKQEQLERAKEIKAVLFRWFNARGIPSETQQRAMRLIDDYADAIHAYRLAELVEKIQGA